MTGRNASTTTRANGAFELEPLLPGTYTIVALDTSLAVYVEPRRVEAVAEVQRGQMTHLQMSLPPMSRAADAACKRTSARTSVNADVFGRVMNDVHRAGGERPRLRAVYQMRDGGTISDHHADVDEDGNFRLCDVARHQPMTLNLKLGSVAADTTFTIDDNLITSFQWDPSFAVVAALPTARSVRGVVVDSGNRPVRDVQVSARGSGSISTDNLGRFHFDLPRSDPVVLDLRRLGFMPSQFALGSGDDTALVITMLPAVQRLAKVEVTDRAAASARLFGFEQRLSERRRATTSGYFITSAEIELRRPDRTTSLFSAIPGMRILRISLVDYGVYGISRDSRGGAACPATIYLDGNRIPDVDIDAVVQPLDVAGIEVYPSANATPPQYQNLNGGCAVVLIWRKGG